MRESARTVGEPNDDISKRLLRAQTLDSIERNDYVSIAIVRCDIGDRHERQSVRGRMVASGGASHLAAEESPGSIGQAAR